MDILKTAATEEHDVLWPRLKVDVLWPRLRADVERARTLARIVQFQDPEPVQADQSNMDQDLRRLNVRILALEAALTDSHAEAAELSEYLEVCAQMMENQEQQMSERQRSLQEGVDEVLGRSRRNEQDILDLWSSHNASAERTDLAAAEFFEFANTASLLAAQASNRAELNAEEIELLGQRILHVDEEVRAAAERHADELRDADRKVGAMAKTAMSTAESSAESITGVRADLARDLRDAARLAQKATERLKTELQADLENETTRIRSLRRKPDSEVGDEAPSAPAKRFRYYLAEQKAPTKETKAPPAGSPKNANSGNDS